MNQMAKLPKQGDRLLPVHETDALRYKAEELERIANDVSRALASLNYQTEESVIDRSGFEKLCALRSELEKLDRDLEKLGELPAHTEDTIALLDRLMQEATPEQIADGLTVLHGLFGSRGDPWIMASTGVDLIEATHAPRVVLYSAVLALLRPAPKECPSDMCDWDDLDKWKRPAPRKFIPTITEVLAELEDLGEIWRKRQRRLEGLPERHAEACQKITRRIAELKDEIANQERVPISQDYWN